MLGSALLLSRRRMTSIGLPPLHTLLPPQVLFGVSIRDNIAYGRLWEPVSQQEIEEAAIAANAHDFIVGLAQASTLASSCFQLALAPPRSSPLGPESSDQFEARRSLAIPVLVAIMLFSDGSATP
jgi:hypothetical protein